MPRPNYVVIFDCDGTLIKRPYSLMSIVDEALNESDRQVMNALRERYFPKIFSETLTVEEARELITLPISIYIGCGLTTVKIKKVLSKVSLRRKVEETFKFLNKQGIPIAIISFGIKQFIETVLEQQKVRKYISGIYAADLSIKKETICGYEPGTVVITENKGVFSEHFARQHGVPAKNILAIGDSMVDQNLGYFRYNRLGLAETEEEKQKIKKYFGEVVVTEDFGPVLEWLKKKFKTA